MIFNKIGGIPDYNISFFEHGTTSILEDIVKPISKLYTGKDSIKINLLGVDEYVHSYGKTIYEIIPKYILYSVDYIRKGVDNEILLDPTNQVFYKKYMKNINIIIKIKPYHKQNDMIYILTSIILHEKYG